MPRPESCPVCCNTGAEITDAIRDSYVISCPICGAYEISDHAVGRVRNHRDVDPSILSAALRVHHERGDQPTLTTGRIQSVIDSVHVPSGPFEKIDMLVEHVAERAETPGSAVDFSLGVDYPLVFAANREEFEYYISKALNLGYLETNAEVGFQLGLEGWKRIRELEKSGAKSDQAFVAMWFHEEMDEAWEQGFRPALDELDYDPIRIDLVDHNEKICDRIISEIRRSGLFISDVTGHRTNVYFEMGYAMGADIPVVRTCRDTHIDELSDYFDVRQYNHIVWSETEDLKTQLIDRVRATV